MLTTRAILTALHGMCFGGFALLTAFGLVVGVRVAGQAAADQAHNPVRGLERVYLVATVLLAWIAVLSGTFLVYPWYRATPPRAATDLHAFPRALLLSTARSAPWHSVGMEWKEHVAFLAPVVVTAVVAAWWRYRPLLLRDRSLRRAVLAFGLIGVGATGVAALLGALLNKLAPVY